MERGGEGRVHLKGNNACMDPLTKFYFWVPKNHPTFP